MKQDRSTIHCPRCGYDQRGVVATWTNAWPLTGTCAECGLAFDWGPVLAPDRFEPSWCVEYARGVRSFLRNCWRTLWTSFWPWRFWSRLQMSHTIRWGRLVAYVLVVAILPVLLLYVPTQTAVAIAVRANIRSIQIAQRQAEKNMMWQLQAALQSPGVEALSEERRKLYEGAMARLQQMNPQQVTIDQSYLTAIAEAVFTPFGGTSRGSMTIGGGMVQYVAPRDLYSILHTHVLSQFGWTGTKNQWFDGVAYTLLGLASNAILVFAIPAGFILLPASRRRAKVRWRHVGRVALYGVPLVAAVFWLCVLAAIIGAVATPLQVLMLNMVVALSTIGIMLVLNFWWAIAISRYLKMPHGWAIPPMLTIIAMLVPAVAVGSASLEMALAMLWTGAALSGCIFVVILIGMIRTRRAAAES